MASDRDNIIDFPRQKLPPRGDKDVSYEKYEKVVRVQIKGDVCGGVFHDWIVAEAVSLDLVGWARESKSAGGMDAIFAGTRDAVQTMMGAFDKKSCPIAAPNVAERPLRGDEPLWSGFHHLPPL